MMIIVILNSIYCVLEFLGLFDAMGSPEAVAEPARSPAAVTERVCSSEAVAEPAWSPDAAAELTHPPGDQIYEIEVRLNNGLTCI